MSKRKVILSVFIIVLFAVSIFLRFSNLGNKVYWVDEAITSLRLSGYSVAQVVETLFDGKVFYPQQLLQYQHPGQDTSIFDVITSSAKEDPHIPPLYYLFARAWAFCFGSSPAAIRSLSAFASIFVLIAGYFLARELFQSNRTGIIMSLLLAVSPLQLLYAQEARFYAIFNVIVLASGYLLLRAIRCQNTQTWLWRIYALLCTMGIYLHPSFICVMAAHAVSTLFLSDKSKRKSNFTQFCMASFLTICLFVPWLLVAAMGRSALSDNTTWLSYSIPLSRWLNIVLANLGHVFVDFAPSWQWLFSLLLPFVLVLEACAFYWLYKTAKSEESKSWIFVFSLALLPPLVLVPQDLIFGGIRSIIARYFFPSFLAIDLACAYLFSSGISSSNLIARRFWQATTCLLLLAGLFSCSMILPASFWWTKSVNRYTQATASVINRLPKPLVLASYTADNLDCSNLFTLAYYLRKDVALEVTTGVATPSIPSGYSQVLVYMPTSGFRERLEKNLKCHLQLMDNQGLLWLAKSTSTEAPSTESLAR